MSMSTRVEAYKDPEDEKYIQYKAIWDACREAYVQVPDEVMSYFGYETPDEHGVRVNLKHEKFSDRDSVSDGIIIKVADIPKDVTVIRFVNSY